MPKIAPCLWFDNQLDKRSAIRNPDLFKLQKLLDPGSSPG